MYNCYTFKGNKYQNCFYSLLEMGSTLKGKKMLPWGVYSSFLEKTIFFRRGLA